MLRLRLQRSSISPIRYSVSNSTWLRKSSRNSARQPRNPRWMSERKHVRTESFIVGGIGLMTAPGDLQCARRVECFRDKEMTRQGRRHDIQLVTDGSSQNCEDTGVGSDGMMSAGSPPTLVPTHRRVPSGPHLGSEDNGSPLLHGIRTS